MVSPVVAYLDPSAGRNAEEMPEELRKFASRSYQNQEVAVLVSDMSGFTKLTREHGIIHFASIIARLRQLTLPIMDSFGAILITTEGDSFHVIFPKALNAVLAAQAMKRVVNEYNNSLDRFRKQFTLTLDGIGVDLGAGPILDKAGKLHGPVFHNAHLLGEDCCSKMQIAISSKVHDAVKDAPELAKAHFKQLNTSDLGSDENAKEAFRDMGSIFELIMPSDDVCPLPSEEAADYLHRSLLPFARRHAPSLSTEDLARLDEKIRDAYMTQKAALMFDFCFENVATPAQELCLKYDCLAKFACMFNCYEKLVAAEDILYLFDDPVDAILIALACRRIIERDNRKLDTKKDPTVSISGFGIHIGDVLYVAGTDIHWGDPVNSASKLGQDIAQDGEIFISNDTYNACHKDPRLAGCKFEQSTFYHSGVNFKPWKVVSDKIPGFGPSMVDNRQREDKRLMNQLMLSDFIRCHAVKNNSIDRQHLARLIRNLAPHFTEEDVQLVLEGSCTTDATSIGLEQFLDSMSSI